MNAVEDVIVIGGGPAGAACALWAHQLGLKTLLLEAGSRIGGLQLMSPYLNRWIPGVLGRSGQEVAESLQRHLDLAGVPFVLGVSAQSIEWDRGADTWMVSNGRRTFTAHNLVIATGATPKSTQFVESETVGIGPGMAMERLAVAGKRVAILGGGDNAFDQAAFALQRGATSVDIFSRSAPRANPTLMSKINAISVHIGPFEADQGSMTVNGRSFEILSIQFGFEARVPAGLRLPMTNGYIAVDRHGKVPGLPNLYAAGEVTNYMHPCVATSYAHGVQVAKAISQSRVEAA